MNFINNLKKLLLKSNMPQKELAKKLQKSEAAISRYLSGDREPDLKTLEQLTIIFNCNYDDLLK